MSLTFVLSKQEITEANIALQLFPGYSAADVKFLEEFLDSEGNCEPGFVYEFIGSRIRSASLWREARLLDGQKLSIPVPADFHAETIEWLGVLKAVRSAVGQYASLELGAGFGPWTVAGGHCARRKGIERLRLYAVEGDNAHFRLLQQHLVDNHFEPHEYHLIEGAVGTHCGSARWPALSDTEAVESWGCRPMLKTADYTGREYERTVEVKVMALSDLLRQEPVWNLLHVDIQGSEVEVCRSCIKDLTNRVSWMVCATHSRKLDGDLLEMMWQAGWKLEHEKPARFHFRSEVPTLEAMTNVDGTQVWRNPKINFPGESLLSFAQKIVCRALPTHDVPFSSSLTLQVEVKNTGEQSWYGGEHEAPIRLGYRWFNHSGSILPDEGARAVLHAQILRSGETSRASLAVLVPFQPGTYTLRISMVQEGVAWFFSNGCEGITRTLRVV